MTGKREFLAEHYVREFACKGVELTSENGKRTSKKRALVNF